MESFPDNKLSYLWFLKHISHFLASMLLAFSFPYLILILPVHLCTCTSTNTICIQTIASCETFWIASLPSLFSPSWICLVHMLCNIYLGTNENFIWELMRISSSHIFSKSSLMYDLPCQLFEIFLEKTWSYICLWAQQCLTTGRLIVYTCGLIIVYLWKKQ